MIWEIVGPRTSGNDLVRDGQERNRRVWVSGSWTEFYGEEMGMNLATASVDSWEVWVWIQRHLGAYEIPWSRI
jgi:hypothetical protein